MLRLEKQMETASTMLEDHENRLVLNQHNSDTYDNKFKDLQMDFDNLTYRVNKFDNNKDVRTVLEGTELTEQSIDIIMNAITELQDKMDNQVNVKLEAYVNMTVFNNMEGENKVLDRRLTKNETDINDNTKA